MGALEGSVLGAAMEDKKASGEVVPAAPPAIRKLDETEITKLENSFLKIDNLRKSKTIMERDIQIADAHILTEQQRMTAFRDQLSQKYGCDLTKARITPDGTIIPGAAAAPTNAAQNPIAAALVGSHN